jgi:DNA primase
MVDTRTLLDGIHLAALIERDLGQPVRREGRWLKWICPFHADSKTPSLGVAGNRWKCFGCGRAGDAIDWLREREGLSFQAACQRLGSTDLLSALPKTTHPQPQSSTAPAAVWQDAALEVASTCQAVLWSDVGTRARVWLNRRGLTDETVRHWGLGFNPDHQRLCGLWVPRGIVIPCLVAGRIWYLKIRRASGHSKYSQVRGGQIALYGADTIISRDAMVVTEGEFDAVLLHQEAGDLAGVATLGSAVARLPDAWVPYLLGLQSLLVAYDTDSAGIKGAAMWESICPRAQRIVPLAGKDVTDYYLSGGDLRAWVQFALSARWEPAAASLETQTPVSRSSWKGQRVSIEDLPDLKAELGLQVVGGDPDLNARPWRPKLYLRESRP